MDKAESTHMQPFLNVHGRPVAVAALVLRSMNSSRRLSCIRQYSIPGATCSSKRMLSRSFTVVIQPPGCYQEGAAGQALQEPRAADHEDGQPSQHSAPQAVLLFNHRER